MQGVKFATDEERREAARERSRRWRANHRDEDRRRSKEYRLSHKELCAERVKRSVEKNPAIAWRAQRKAHPYVANNEWSKIEGYEMVLKDGCDYLNTKGRWVVHHKLEREFSADQLKAADMYYNRPPEELVWMTTTAHKTLHLTWRNPMRDKNKLVNK